MKKVPKVSHKWWSKMFFPHLLATQAYRYVFRNRPSKIDPVKARKITDVLALGYVLLASTACGLGKFAKQIRGRIETKLVIRKKPAIWQVLPYHHILLFLQLIGSTKIQELRLDQQNQRQHIMLD